MKKTSAALLALYLAICLSAGVFASGGTLYSRPADYTYDSALPRVIDEAGLLSDYEKSGLEALIDGIISTYSFDVVILTVNSTGEKTVEQFADDYYDYGNYGCGENADGLLFLLSMSGRDYYTSTSGKGIEVFTDYGIEYISDMVVSDLSAGEYFKAFSRYLGYVEKFLQDEQNDNTIYDIGKRYRENPFALDLRTIAICLAAGFIASFITVSAMKNKMNTAKPRDSARDYVGEDTFNLTLNEDRFLFRTTSRVKVQKNTSSGGGGSSTHTGSSGRSHGGGGGKF